MSATEPGDPVAPAATDGAPDAGSPSPSAVADLRQRLRQLAQPLVDTIDARLAAQVDARVDERVEVRLRDRLAVIERAIADLDRAVTALEARLGE